MCKIICAYQSPTVYAHAISLNLHNYMHVIYMMILIKLKMTVLIVVFIPFLAEQAGSPC